MAYMIPQGLKDAEKDQIYNTDRSSERIFWV